MTDKPYSVGLNLSQYQPAIDAGLVKVKEYENGLCVLKYAREVFYDKSWGLDPMLLESRGHVFDKESGEVVIWPFTKVFNRGENGTDVDRDQIVVVPRKVNGFMASVTVYKGELLVATTGSLDSDFVEMAKEKILTPKNNGVLRNLITDTNTALFEVVHENDPHIVEEVPGAYLIGIRNHEGGYMVNEVMLDAVAEGTDMLRPEWFRMRMSDVVRLSRTVYHEGFMVRDEKTGEILLKIKSPHYLGKKFLMRMGGKKAEAMFRNPELTKQNIDEEFFSVIDQIMIDFKLEDWKALTEKERRQYLEGYFCE